MQSHALPKNGRARTRWAARLLSLIVTAWWLLLSVFFVRANDEITMQGTVITGLAWLACLGLLAAWRWERPGGWLAVIAALALGVAAVGYNLTSLTLALIAVAQLVPPLLLPGLLFLSLDGHGYRPVVLALIGWIVLLLIGASTGLGVVRY